MTDHHTAGPGPRKEVGTAASSQANPPHATTNDHGAPVQESTTAPNTVPVSPANAHGHDRVPADKARSDEESMYDGRPGEHKDRRETDMP